MIRKALYAGAFALAATVGTSTVGTPSNAAPIDLGFIMDGSGSLAQSDYLSAMDSLAAALAANIPVGGPNTYTISVVSFGTTGRLDISKTINTAADLAAVVSAVDNATFLNGGSTNYQAAFNTLIAASSPMAGTGIVNMMTDGNANNGDTAAGKAALQAAGWDSLSFEAVGGFVSTAPLVALGYDTLGDGATLIGNAGLITNPLNDAFVLTLGDFTNDYKTAIGQKIQKTVSPVPVPASLPALASGLVLFGFVARRRRKTA